MEKRTRESTIERRTVLFWSVGLLIPACSGARAPRQDPYPAAERAWPEVVEHGSEPEPGTEPASEAAEPVVAETESQPPVEKPLEILSRQLWATEPADTARAAELGDVRWITIHHEGAPVTRSAMSREETGQLLDRLRSYHVQARGWADIGYHYIIDPAGRVWEGRPASLRGAHVRDHNENNLGVMLLGNFELQSPSQAQLETLPRLVRRLRWDHGVPERAIKSHREWVATACPGEHLQPRFEAMRSEGAFA
ncbi:MAG: peptidoglycan recognition family protein [Planctomycetota bacterium]